MNLCLTALVFIAYFLSVNGLHDKGILSQQPYYQGDIVLPARARNGILKSQRWTNGIIPYVIKDSYTQPQLDLLQAAMNEIQRYTCIRFVRRSSEKNYLAIERSDACGTRVGMVGGEQRFSMLTRSDIYCWTYSNLVHELLHTIGLFHEQSRYDRDSYITINWDNIQYGRQNINYQQYFTNETDTYGMPYDYYSVMNYDAWSSAIDSSKMAMVPKQPYYIHIMGFAAKGSDYDYMKVRRIYECTGSYPTVSDNMPTCEDKRDDCDAQVHKCDKVSAMVNECRKTCGYCGKGGVPTKVNINCKDTITYCNTMLDQCGQTVDMTRFCRKSCNFCDYSQCTDTHGSCDYYKNECNSAAWMKTSCRKTCRFC